MARAYVAAFNAPLARDVRTVMMDRVVTGSLPSIDVKNFSSDETRRVEIQYFPIFLPATHRVERGKEWMGFGVMHLGRVDTLVNKTHRSKSSTNSTMRSTRLSPTRK
jgi:hypothetical protein